MRVTCWLLLVPRFEPLTALAPPDPRKILADAADRQAHSAREQAAAAAGESEHLLAGGQSSLMVSSDEEDEGSETKVDDPEAAAALAAANSAAAAKLAKEVTAYVPPPGLFISPLCSRNGVARIAIAAMKRPWRWQCVQRSWKCSGAVRRRRWRLVCPPESSLCPKR